MLIFAILFGECDVSSYNHVKCARAIIDFPKFLDFSNLAVGGFENDKLFMFNELKPRFLSNGPSQQ